MKIAFITEASTKIGYGHLYRSIALAQEFISKNLEIDFFCDGKTAIEIIKKYLPKTNIYQTSELSLIIQEYNLLIIDVYKSSWSTYEWLTQLSDLKTASIIDYAFKEYSIPTDFIFQIGFQEYSFKETSHQNENGKISKVYSGNDFFIFREEFKKARTFEVRKDAKKILVSMGGSDPYKLTELVSESLVEIHKPLIITLILGAEINEKRLSSINSVFSE
jgi:spore coat polysaccharide biosynthesis predicted glycosyltransferase SpsG